MEDIVILCPSHDINDKRINRITKVLSRRYNTKSFYEESWRLSNSDDDKGIFYLRNKMSYFRMKSILKNYHVSPVFSVYIHDPGFFGLFLCWWWSKNRNIKSMTFDYHDWLPWEISFHLRKVVRNRKLTMLLSRLLYSFIRKCFSSLKIDNLVGISREQIFEFSQDFKVRDARELVLPNTRKRLALKKSINEKDFDGIVWLGNIMKGRDIDILNEYLKKFNQVNKTHYRLYLVGNIFHKDYFINLEAQDHIVYLGTFRNDLEIFEKIRDYNVAGFFYGWNDIYNTGINRIASPNKAHSYVNLGIPSIMGGHLTSLKSTFRNDGDCIFWIEGYADFERSVNYIRSNYNSIIESFDIQTKWEAELEIEISNFFLSN